MNTKTNKRVRVISPIGTCTWAAVDKPFARKGSTDRPSYSIRVVLSKEDGETLLTQLKPIIDDAKAMQAEALKVAKNGKERKEIEGWDFTSIISKEEDEDGNETGRYVLSVKQAAEIKRKDGTVSNATIGVFDARNNELRNSKLGKGSLVRVSFDPKPYASGGLGKFGVSGYLVAVKVLKLVEFGGVGTAASAGFEVEEGYEVETSEAPFEAGSSTSSGDVDF